MKITNNKNVKYLILIPVFVLFFITVTAISGKSNKKTLFKKAQNNDITKIVIDKNTSDKDFSNIMTSLREKGAIATFKNINRNENNEIIAIDIDITKNGSTSSYSAKSNMAIHKIIIKIDAVNVSIHNEGLFLFGFSNLDEISKLIKQKEQVFNNFNFPKFEEIEEEVLDKEKFNFSEKNKSTYIVNGKEMTKEAYEGMDKSKIKTLEIKKEVIKTYRKSN